VLAFSDRQPSWREHESYRIVNATNGEERLSVAFHYSLSADALEEQIIELAVDERDVFGSGRTYARVSDAPQSYREALRALRYGRFMSDTGRTRIEEVEGNVQMPADMLKHEEAVIVSLRIGDEEGLTRALEGFEVWVAEQQLDPERIEQEMLKLAYLGRSVAEENAVDEGLAEKIRHQELSAMHARGDMFRWLRKQLDAQLAWKKAASRSPRHAAVNQALAYLEERYGQNVSLQELAEHVGMSPTYLSLLFKEEMGTTYIKHLTHIRMERAKEMLRNGLRVSEVSDKVGYLNYRHFTEIFKKHVGVTPGQYRGGYHAGNPG
jgi:two-component system, response regulator YesN